MAEKLWSHLTSQNRDEATPDELEALSRRYGVSTLVLLPLSSGRWATFFNDRQLIAITEEPPGAEELRRWSREKEEMIRKAQEIYAEMGQGRRAAPKVIKPGDIGI